MQIWVCMSSGIKEKHLYILLFIKLSVFLSMSMKEKRKLETFFQVFTRFYLHMKA